MVAGVAVQSISLFPSQCGITGSILRLRDIRKEISLYLVPKFIFFFTLTPKNSFQNYKLYPVVSYMSQPCLTCPTFKNEIKIWDTPLGGSYACLVSVSRNIRYTNGTLFGVFVLPRKVICSNQNLFPTVAL